MSPFKLFKQFQHVNRQKAQLLKWTVLLALAKKLGSIVLSWLHCKRAKGSFLEVLVVLGLSFYAALVSICSQIELSQYIAEFFYLD